MQFIKTHIMVQLLVLMIFIFRLSQINIIVRVILGIIILMHIQGHLPMIDFVEGLCLIRFNMKFIKFSSVRIMLLIIEFEENVRKYKN